MEKIPWRRDWLPTPVFLPVEFHGQRSLADYSPWGCKESDRTEQLTLSLSGLNLEPMRNFTGKMGKGYDQVIHRGFPGRSDGKEFTAMQETLV